MKAKLFCLFFILVLAFPINSFAESSTLATPPLNITGVTEGEYVCDEELNDPGTIQPFVTCTGNGGVARINALTGGLTWNVDPSFSTVYNFEGVITIINTFTGLPVAAEVVACTGALGGACGGEYYPGLPVGNYVATLAGSAQDLSGLFGWIVPPCSTFFIGGPS